MVRFPRVGMVCADYSDEKVAMEVTALSLIHNGTTILVPKVQAWGPATSNVILLGLGPFIIMDFISGVSLSNLLEDPNAERPTRLMREGISDSDIEVIYRQLANSYRLRGGTALTLVFMSACLPHDGKRQRH